MDQWFGVGVEIQCHNIYQGQGLVEEDHLESRQNNKSEMRIIRCVPTVNNTKNLKAISGATQDIADGGRRESS